MFETVEHKIERAKHFLEKIKTEPIGTEHWRAYLEAYFFELVSAKEFFFQAINDKYGLGLERDKATRIGLLKQRLDYGKHGDALEVVKSIEKELSDPNSWLWRLNNYRNSATHRELLHMSFFGGTSDHVEAYLFEDPEDSTKGNMKLEVIPYCEQSLTAMRGFLEQLYSKLN